jgi:hypothetical protein
MLGKRARGLRVLKNSIIGQKRIFDGGEARILAYHLIGSVDYGGGKVSLS